MQCWLENSRFRSWCCQSCSSFESAVTEAKVKPPNGVRRPSRFGRSSAYAGPVAAQQATTTGNQSPAVVAGGNVAINYGMSSEEREAFAKQVAEKLLAQ